MRGRSVLSTVLLLLVLALTVQAQINTIRGKVRSTSGVTVNNAIVELTAGGIGIIAQTVTRNDGDFVFSSLETGVYEVVVTLSGYEPAVQTARFSSSSRMNLAEVINMDITIRPRAGAVLAMPGTSFAQDVPKPARASFEKGIARLREGKWDEGITKLREAISIFADYFDAHFALGKELFRLGKDIEALEEFERARQINERQDAVYFMFGMVMLKQQKFALAQRAFREATTLNEGRAASHYYRGQALVELALRGTDETQRTADLTEAEKALNRAWELSDKQLASVYVQRARIYERRGDKEAAARALEDYLRAEPEAKNAAAIRTAITRLRNPTKPEPPANQKTPQP